MQLTAVEYERGLLTWQPVNGMRVYVGTSTAGGEVQWTGPYNDPDGSVLQPVAGPRIQIRVENIGRINLGDAWVRVERTTNGVVRTCIWLVGRGGEPIVLRHVPGFGTYHRLVVDAGTLGWDQDLVVREGSLLIRLVTGAVEGERNDDLKAVANPDGTIALQGTQETATATGRFIEIVAAGDSPEEAELHAHAFLGLLALAFGQNALGKTVFSEPWIATPNGQEGAAIALGSEFPRQVAEGEFTGLDALARRVLAVGRMERARVIGLRWYERGFRAAEPLDMLLSFYIGIEALVSAYASDSAPLPIERQRQAENDAILRAVVPLGNAVRDRVAGRIRGTTTREQFQFYAQGRNLADADVASFRDIKNTRDRAVHGDPVNVDLETARRAERLLRLMLKAELNITDELPWETHPVIYRARLEFSLVNAREAR